MNFNSGFSPSFSTESAWLDRVLKYMEHALSPEGDAIERFATIQRIQDVEGIFTGCPVDPNYDFSQQHGLRYLHQWDGANAYHAVATWMSVVGREQYQQYLGAEDIAKQFGHAAVDQLSRRIAGGQDVQTESMSFQTIRNQSTSQEQVVHYKAAVHRMLHEQTNEWRGIIANYEQYKAYKSAYVSCNNPEPQLPVTMIPEHDLNFQNCVRRLYNAILDMDDVIENPRLRPQHRAKKRKSDLGQDEGLEFMDCVAVSRVKELKPIEIELLCWQILEEAWYIQQGDYDMPPWYDPPNRASKKPGQFVSFRERLAKCEEALRQSKNCIKQMLNVDFAKRLAYNPEQEVKRKIDNKKVNLKRDGENKAGKYAQAAGLVKIDAQDRSIISATGQNIAPAHPPTARMAAEMAQGQGDRLAAGPGAAEDVVFAAAPEDSLITQTLQARPRALQNISGFDMFNMSESMVPYQQEFELFGPIDLWDKPYTQQP